MTTVRPTEVPVLDFDQGRDLRERLSNDRSLIPNAIEEFLRVSTPETTIDRTNSHRFTDRAAANGWITMPAHTNHPTP